MPFPQIFELKAFCVWIWHKVTFSKSNNGIITIVKSSLMQHWDEGTVMDGTYWLMHQAGLDSH